MCNVTLALIYKQWKGHALDMMIFHQQLKPIADSEFRRQSSKGTVLPKYHRK